MPFISPASKLVAIAGVGDAIATLTPVSVAVVPVAVPYVYVVAWLKRSVRVTTRVSLPEYPKPTVVVSGSVIALILPDD
jgi:hypothetical protein